MAELTTTIGVLCLLLRQAPFILMAPTMRGMTPEAQQLLVGNHASLLSMADELTLQPDGSFKSVHGLT